MQPWDADGVVCSNQGILYDIGNLLPFLKKYKRDPITGEEASVKDYFPCSFHKNEDGQYQCPVTQRVFNAQTKIVVIRTSGHVFCYEGIKELCLNTGDLHCPATGKDFTKSDIVVIQDPNNREQRNLKAFFHVKEQLSTKAKSSSTSHINVDPEMKRVFATMEKKGLMTEKEKKKKGGSAADDADALRAAAPGLTSTTLTSETITAVKPWETPKKTKKKGYVRLETNMGALNFRIHADLAPLASENFLALCANGYYNGTKFHRLIKNFMIQGGDPTATGRGGESVWKHTFRDEFAPQLKHEGSGVLAMANSGANTNGSQFYVTFKSASHLDRKHTVFGELVGGAEVLSAMENVSVDASDKPLKDIVLERATVFVNPFDADEMEKEKLEATAKVDEARELERMRHDPEQRGQWFSNPAASHKMVAHGDGVGKYMAPSRLSTSTSASIGASGRSKGVSLPPARTASSAAFSQPKAKKAKSSLSDFSSW